MIAGRILQLCPRTVPRLVEPFAGSAAMSLAAASRQRAKKFWINDAHSPLVSLWREILRRPEVLADSYEALWQAQQGCERKFFDDVRSRFNDQHDPADFLYLLARCVKAAIRYNAQGKFNNTPDNRRLGARPREMRRRIVGAAELLRRRTRLTSYDYKRVLSQCDSSDLVYMDPPYQGVCKERDQRYAPKVDHAEFCAVLENLNDRRIMYVVSYDGRTGDKEYGKPLPEQLELVHLEIRVGRSTQATLLGRSCVTYESLYVSPALRHRLPEDAFVDAQLQLAFA